MKNRNNQLLYRRAGDGDGCQWNYATGLDEMRSTGSYILQLRHGSAANGLPLPACTNDHYIEATLIVAESGTDDRLQKNRLIGQTLIMPQCSDGKTHIFTRTLNCAAGGSAWSSWDSVATMAELDARISGTKDVVWGASSCVDTFVTAGVYNINGQRLNVNDALPIANSNPGHTISARLVVLDSSIAGTGDEQDKCITQMLTLSNRTGGDGDVYIRTGWAHSTNVLAGGSGWEPWGKLQQNIEVGQVASLDTFTGNGIYSGVYTNGSSFFETFVMVVINNYAVAGATGNIRCISQFKYALNVDSTFSYKTRTGRGGSSIEWGSWVDLGAATTTDIQDNSITAQKLSSDVRKKVENPLRPLYIAAGAEYNDTGADKTKTAPWGETVVHKAGHYYLNGLGDITEEQMVEIYNTGHLAYSPNIACRYARNTIRTNLIHKNTGWNVSSGAIDAVYMFYSCSNLETCVLSNLYWNEALGYNYFCFQAGNIRYMFDNCKKLKTIEGVISCETGKTAGFMQAFSRCPLLTYVNVYKLNQSISFIDSPNFSKSSIIYAVSNASPTSAITITLHPDAYARLADDVDIVAALEAQPFISLVSA